MFGEVVGRPRRERSERVDRRSVRGDQREKSVVGRERIQSGGRKREGRSRIFESLRVFESF